MKPGDRSKTFGLADAMKLILNDETDSSSYESDLDSSLGCSEAQPNDGLDETTIDPTAPAKTDLKPVDADHMIMGLEALPNGESEETAFDSTASATVGHEPVNTGPVIHSLAISPVESDQNISSLDISDMSADDTFNGAESGSVRTDNSTVDYGHDTSVESIDYQDWSSPSSVTTESIITESDTDVSASDGALNHPGPSNEEQAATRKRHAKPREDLWKKTIKKMARLEGKEYLSTGKDKMATVDKRKMGPGCSSAFCLKSAHRHCSTFDEERRRTIFADFWKMETWQERMTYVKTSVTNVAKKEVTPGSSKRESIFCWSLRNSQGELRQVCRTMFSSTLGVSQKTLNNWVRVTTENPSQTALAVTQRPSPSPTNISQSVSEADKQFLKDFLLNIPTVPSHYCRRQKSYENKRFIFEGKSQRQLHCDYVEQCNEKGFRAMGWKYFNGVFHSLNLSIFVPKKDQCDTCVGFKQGTVDKKSYELHINKKTGAQELKAADKTNQEEGLSVWTMDLQSVLMCPRTKASALYYRTKLILHNMTYFNIKTKEGYCYVFDETNGDLSSKMFGYLHHRHFSMYLEQHPEIKRLVIWSDGCGYQNKSAAISNSLIQLSVDCQLPVEQKFLTPGHTQMECDSMHSVIERKLKCDIFVPRDYMLAMEMARDHPGPYKVTEVIYSDVKMLSGDFTKSIRPGKKTGDPTVSDVCAYRYCTSAAGVPQIFYKLQWQDDWTALPARLVTDKKTWRPLFQDRLTVTQKKYHDLQAMKSVMPRCVHHFFDTLPYH